VISYCLLWPIFSPLFNWKNNVAWKVLIPLRVFTVFMLFSWKNNYRSPLSTTITTNTTIPSGTWSHWAELGSSPLIRRTRHWGLQRGQGGDRQNVDRLQRPQLISIKEISEKEKNSLIEQCKIRILIIMTRKHEGTKARRHKDKKALNLILLQLGLKCFI